MSDFETMTASELRQFISVTEVALDHAKKTADQPLADTAQRDINSAASELARR